MKVCEGVEVDIQAFLTCAVAGVGRLKTSVCLLLRRQKGDEEGAT